MPDVVDLLCVAPWDTWHTTLSCWTWREPGVAVCAGRCKDLWNTRLHPRMDPPAIIIVNGLKDTEWAVGDVADQIHVLEGTVAKVYARRDPMRYKWYFYCLMARKSLVGRQMTILRADQPSRYYRDVLLSQKPADVSVYVRKSAARPGPPQARARQRSAGAFCVSTDSGSGSDSGAMVCWQDDPPHGSEADDDDDVKGLAEDVSGSGLADQSRKRTRDSMGGQTMDAPAVVAGSGAGSSTDPPPPPPVPPVPQPEIAQVAGRRMRHTREVVATVHGVDIRRAVLGSDAGYNPFVVRCPLADADHSGPLECRKYRGAHKGDDNAVAYLGAWVAAACSFGSRDEHVRWNPGSAVVRKLMETDSDA